MADLQSFDGAVKGLEATVRPELLEPFVELLSISQVTLINGVVYYFLEVEWQVLVL